jgi:hypothetical protein
MPPVLVDKINPALSITQLGPQCPPNIVGGITAENSLLTLSCASGVFSKVVFAEFGTPTGACNPGYNTSTCHAPNSYSVVAALCLGKSSCTLNATNGAFGGDPCYGTAKTLAVELSGCEPAPASPVYVVDFGENLSGWTRINVKGPAGTTIVLRHAEVLQHAPLVSLGVFCFLTFLYDSPDIFFAAQIWACRRKHLHG